MSRSRALNRFNRFTAKRRRRALRSDVPSLREDFHRESLPVDHSEDLLEKACDKETLLDLIEPIYSN